jgi:site-specific recombinase XerD
MSSSPLSQAISAFEVHLRVERNLAPKTIHDYLRDLADLTAHLHGAGLVDPPVAEIGKDHIKKFLEHRQVHQGASSRSLARYLSALRGFFRFCVDQEHIETNPTETFRSPKLPKRLPIYMVESELRALFSAPDQSTLLGVRDHAVLVVLANTGLRVSELVGLTLDNVDLDRGVLRVFGKGRKERLVPTNDAVKAVLSGWLQVRPVSESKSVFVGTEQASRGKPLGVRGVQLLMKKHGLKANIPRERLTPHKLRHTFATLLHMNDVDIIEIQALLGHANISSTQIYTHTDAGRLRSAVDKLGPLGGES